MPRPTDHDLEARALLEGALTDIEGVSKILLEFAMLGSNDQRSDICGYLGAQLHDHAAAAHAAYCRIVKLDDYATPKDGSAG